MDIVIISVLAVVAGANGRSDIVQFAEDRQDWFKTFLELPARISCDATFRRVFAALDPVKFQAGFLHAPLRAVFMTRPSSSLCKSRQRARRHVSQLV